MEVRFWAATDTGRKRGHNEDNYLVDRHLRLFVVCDGMGGHAAGEVASAAALQAIQSDIDEKGGGLIGDLGGGGDAGSEEELLELLERSVQGASRRVWEMAQRDQQREGMGTTCSLLLLVGARGFVAHVGDSRIYRLRDGEVEQLTDDHSLRNHLIEQGKLGEDEEMDRENPITRAVGVAEEVDVDTFSVDLLPDDRFVLCSDGLTEYLGAPSVLADIAGGTNLEIATQKCIDHANRSGGKDNVTAIVAEVDRGEGIWDAREASPAGRAIRELPQFAHLTPEQFGSVVEQLDYRDIDQGTVLVEEDGTAEGLIVVADGRVRVSAGPGFSETIGSGEYFGEREIFDGGSAGIEAEMVESGAVVVLSRAAFRALLSSESRELAAKLAWNFLERAMSKLRHLGPEEYRHPQNIQSDHRTTADMEAAERDRVAGEESTSRGDGQAISGSSVTDRTEEGETTGGGETDKEWEPEDTLVPELERDESDGNRTSRRTDESDRGGAKRGRGTSDRDRDFGRDGEQDTERLVGILRDAAEQVADDDQEVEEEQDDDGDEGAARETMKLESFDKDSGSRE